MLLHCIVDFSYLYYKYKFQLEAGYLKRLSIEVNGEERDISNIYYPIREIMSFRCKFENEGKKVISSICFDMPSIIRKSEGTESAEVYKANRVSKLTSDDIGNIREIEKMLGIAGYNTYRFEGYEADDIIAELVRVYKDCFDFNVIYTPDMDLAVHISDNVSLQRYKAGRGYTNISFGTYESVLSQECKCNIPYNCITLYKITVGDKSDNIKGIQKFGVKAFDKLVNYLNDKKLNWPMLSDYNNVGMVLDYLKNTKYFTDEQYTQAKEALELVKPLDFSVEIKKPDKESTVELRKEVFEPLGMISLIR